MVALGPSSIRELRDAGLPSDYIQFLATVGYGSVGPDWWSIYQGPIDVETVYGRDLHPERRSLRGLVADDGQGFFLGFDAANRLVEVDPTQAEPILCEELFVEFILSILALHE